jgi:hypothetical protein
VSTAFLKEQDWKQERTLRGTRILRLQMQGKMQGPLLRRAMSPLVQEQAINRRRAG